MRFSEIADTFEKMSATTKRLELTQHLVELFQKTPPEIISKIVYLIQGKLRPDFEGIELGLAEKLAIHALSKSSGIPIKKINSTYAEDGDLGGAAAKIMEQKTQTTFLAQDITAERVYETLYKIAKLEGQRSQDMKMKYVSSLLNDATPQEAKFILKIAMGTLRLGIADNTVMDALAISYTGSKENRQRLEAAYNVSSDLGAVAETISRNGLKGLDEFHVKVFSPIRPMLAERVKSESEAIEKLGKEFAAEYKLDGERVQVHYKDNTMILYSRRLENITSYYPDILENLPKALKTTDVILEAEAVAINQDSGEFLPFQELMHRRRKYDIDRIVEKYPITINLFDVLYLNGKDLLNEPYKVRRKRLEEITSENEYTKIVMQTTVHTENEIEDFLENGINAGCEGLMLKVLDAPYRAGARGNNWLKLKREYRNELGDSLDLVVIGAFFGKGRRTGKYGTLLLASYNQDHDTFESICKVGTGFTDENLDQFYQILQDKVTLKKNPRIESGMEPDVWFEPELVIEIVASEITLSPVHTTAKDSIRSGSGLALRFPKFTGKIRMEKAPEDASTDQEVITLYKNQKKVTQNASDV